MTLRTQFTDQMKASMKAGDAARTSTLRMIMAKLKDTDIAVPPEGHRPDTGRGHHRHAARHGEIAAGIGGPVYARATAPNWPPRKRPRSA